MGEAHCLKVLSDLYLVTERYDDAQECYRRAAELLNTDNPIMFAACLKGQGDVALRKEIYSDARKQYMLAFPIIEDQKDEFGLQHCLIALGEAELGLGSDYHDEATKHFKRAKEILVKKIPIDESSMERIVKLLSRIQKKSDGFSSMIKNGEIKLGGQKALIHDEGHTSGYLHLYEKFETLGASFPSRKLHVFLPRDYENSMSSYPVLYMHDGHTVFFKGGLANQSWDLATVLDELYQDRTFARFIVVAIWPVDRNREYTHARWSGAGCCDLSAYGECVARWVKPFIDQYYRTLPGPRNNITIGASHGGLAAFFIANRYPNLFGFCGAMSPSFWAGIDDGMDFPIVRPRPEVSLRESQLLGLVRDTLEKPDFRPKLYIDWGLVREGGPHNEFIEERATARGREMVQLLQEDFGYRIGIDLEVFEDLAGEHQEKSWSRHMPRLLRWFGKDQSLND